MKRKMKRISSIILTLLVAAVLTFTVLGLNDGGTSAGAESAQTNNMSSVYTGSSSNAQTTSSDSGSVTEVSSDFFSDRDLSGAYDDEVFSITLSDAGTQSDSGNVSVSGSEVTITASGTYVITGTLNDGTIIVDASKDDKVQLVLSGVSIRSVDYAAIYVRQADKVFITLAEGTANTLANGGTYAQRDENEVDAVIFSKDDITFNGTGSLCITASSGSGIVGKDEVTITGGSYDITAAEHAIRAKDSLAVADGTFTLYTTKDGLHAENNDDATLGNIYIAGGTFVIRVRDDAIHANTLLEIDGGSFNITAAEGLEATYIRINAGSIQIAASDDGINAARKSSAYTPTVEINGGDITINMGAGDTDGVDSNGNIIINGGTISVTGQSSFDYDGTAQLNGGTVIVNGQQVDTIPNQIMGGRGGMEGGYGRGGIGGRGGMGGRWGW